MNAPDRLIAALEWLDTGLAEAIPTWLRLVLWGLIGALLSMLLYWLLSPQRRIAALAGEERSLRQRLRTAEEQLSVALAAMRRLLWLAVVRLGLVLMPVAVAALPVVGLYLWLEGSQSYAGRSFLPLGPDWLRGWETVFLLSLLAGSLAIKIGFRIR